MTALRLLLVLLLCSPPLIAAGWKAGAAKALALEDAQGRRAVIISTDTLGITASLYASLKTKLAINW